MKPLYMIKYATTKIKVRKMTYVSLKLATYLWKMSFITAQFLLLVSPKLK